MADSRLREVIGISLTLYAAGQALATEGKVTIFAVTSLANAMQDIVQEYKKEKNVDVMSSFVSSSTLARQIETGALTDLFISADQKWMDYVADRKAVDPVIRATPLGNSLVMVAPKVSAQGAITIDEKTDWTNLLRGDRLAVSDPQHAPAGIYAKEALQKLGAWEALSPKLASTEDVRDALTLVERNKAPLGIAYGSDAAASRGVRVVDTFPGVSHQKVKYPPTIVDDHRNAAVNVSYGYPKGPEAFAIFKRYGFTTR